MQAPKLGGPVRWRIRETEVAGAVGELARELEIVAREIPEDAVTANAAAAWKRAWTQLEAIRAALAAGVAEQTTATRAN